MRYPSNQSIFLSLNKNIEKKIETLSEYYLFSEDIISQLMVLYGDKVESGLQALKHPSRHYPIRVNTIKTEPEDIITSFEKKGIKN